MHTFTSFIAGLLTVRFAYSTPFVASASAQQNLLVLELANKHACSCSGTRETSDKAYICGDSRLGPTKLPTKWPLRGVVSYYDRFGGLTPGEFVAKWTDQETGQFIYPPHNGYLLSDDGTPILANATLPIGTVVDRFGSFFGQYLAAADAPFEQRSLPPSNLDTDPLHPEWPFGYHMYEVTKPLPVQTGIIAPWFGQPGLGAQFWTGNTGNVKFLVENSYLKEVDLSKFPDPGKKKGKCSW